MYYSHFGLTQAPFKITPNTEFFFSGGNRGPILEALIYAISHGEGIVKVTGEVGSGKTMLCHMLPTRLPGHVVTVYIANPSVSPEEILHAIAFELQISVDRNAPRLEVIRALHNFLLARYAEGKRVVVFVEESQSMPLATLEEIRLLSNLETKNDKLLQIVLFGQPELDENLRQPNIRQLRERITHSFRLDPLVPGEIREYLMFRMRAAGYRGPDLFSGSVVKHISRTSLGLTRRVNLIADKALLAAFSENTHTLRPKHIEAAVRDSEFSQEMPRRMEPRHFWSGAVLVVVGAAVGIAVYALLQHGNRGPIPATGPSQAAPPAAVAPEPAPAAAVAPEPAAPATAIAPEQKGPATAMSPELAASPQSGALHASGAPSPQGAVIAPAHAVAAPASAGGTELAASAGSGGENVAAGEENLLESRLQATREWLVSEPEMTVSIQLMGTTNAEQLKEVLKEIRKTLEINKVFVYRTVARRRPWLVVLYGSFDNRRVAQDALDKLPKSLKANRPYLRTVQGIRDEIKQFQAF